MQGQEIQHGQRLALPAGSFPLLVEFKLETEPQAPVYLSPRFFASNDVKSEQERWKAYGLRIKPHLEKVIALAPQSDEAARAKVILTGLQ